MKTVSHRKIDLPVLKVQAPRLFDLLWCAHENPYDREGFKEAVLRLFPGREEKSVFRGMAIPTLRRLGLIIGYEDLIRLSSDGFLMVKAWRLSTELGQRALRAYLLQYEVQHGWGIIDAILKRSYDRDEFVSSFVPYIEAPNSRQAMERLRDWLDYLCFSSLLSCNGELTVTEKNLERAQKDIDSQSKSAFFQKFFLDGYKHVTQLCRGAMTVEIDEVRRVVAEMFLEKKKAILTSRQFDSLLRSSVQMTTREYMVSFGRSMGADEGLFEFRGKYYKTVSVRFDS